MTPIFLFEIDQGANAEFDGYNEDENGVRELLTGYQGRGSAKTAATQATETFPLTVTLSVEQDPDTLADYTHVTVSVAPSVTAALVLPGKDYTEPTAYVYDVELYTTADADVIRFSQGPCLVYPGITTKVS